jgi:hypothetical protein
MPVGNPLIGEVWRTPGNANAVIIETNVTHDSTGQTRTIRVRLYQDRQSLVLDLTLDEFLQNFEWVSPQEMLQPPAHSRGPTEDQPLEPVPPPITHRRNQWEHLLADEDSAVPIEGVPQLEEITQEEFVRLASKPLPPVVDIDVAPPHINHIRTRQGER